MSLSIDRINDPDSIKSKHDGSYLALETLTPSDNYIIFGKTFRFSLSPVHLGLMAFTFGWIDGYCLNVLKTYPSMITGNLIQIARSIDKISLERFQRYSDEYWVCILYRNIVVSIGCGLIGPMLCCYLKKRVRYKENSFVIIITIHFLWYFLTVLSVYFAREEFEDDESNLDDIALLASILLVDSEIYNTAAVFLLSITSGMLIFWGSKVTYTTNMLTLNTVKISETLYRVLANINHGGAKMRGDAIIFCIVLTSFTLGSILSVLATNPTNNSLQFILSSIFIGVIYPLHVLYGYYYPKIERNKIEKSKQLQEKATSNPISLA